mmetsp:Transcript_21197/g.63782  ORF Transcript_21197/g.63782 Transcript_21197/m.63782 type:complete len:615 (-) Transcript_21197:1774-3618(-)
MVTILARSPNLVGSAGSFGSLHKELSVSPAGGGSLAGGAGGGSQNLQQAMSNSQHHGPPRRATRNDIVEAFISNLRARGTIDLESPGILVGIREHFQHLPTRYALDVNIATLDVLNHKRLLDSARMDPSAVSFQVRPVEVANGRTGGRSIAEDRQPSFGSLEQHHVAAHQAERTAAMGVRGGQGLPRPAFGSSPNLQALMLEHEDRHDSVRQDSGGQQATTFYEVTVASVDQPKLLSRLSEALGDLNLNIAEAHAFNTTDRFSLDVFVVTGWTGQGTEELEEVLSQRLQELPPPGESSHGGSRDSPRGDMPFLVDFEQRRRDAEPAAPDDWELDAVEIKFQDRIASGAFGDLYKGTYCGQDVAIKILRNVQDDSQQYAEFLQEVSIMRKVRHKNVVQFIGACTRKPNLCIVVEYMPGGSVYDYMRRAGPLKLPTLLRVAVEICRGMDYLHKRKIAHRDLKAANLLMDETGIVKIADFGVARVMDTAGIMTAETGTYRWMAPEVIEHKPYGERADIFSFGILLWELLTGRVPYEDMTPLQAAVGVVQKGLRPSIPPGTPGPLAAVMAACWVRDPESRPSFEQLREQLEDILEGARADDMRRQNAGFLSKLRKTKP